MQEHRLGANRLHEFQPLVAGVEEIGFETVEWLDTDGDALRLSVLREDLEVFHDQGPLDLLLRGLHGVGLAHHGVNRANETRAAHDGSLIDQCDAVVHRRFLIGLRTAKIATGAHARTDTPDGDTRFFRGGADCDGVDVARVFNGDFDRCEAPFFEFCEERGALGRERRRVEEGIEADSHGRLVEGDGKQDRTLKTNDPLHRLKPQTRRGHSSAPAGSGVCGGFMWGREDGFRWPGHRRHGRSPAPRADIFHRRRFFA